MLYLIILLFSLFSTSLFAEGDKPGQGGDTKKAVEWKQDHCDTPRQWDRIPLRKAIGIRYVEDEADYLDRLEESREVSVSPRRRAANIAKHAVLLKAGMNSILGELSRNCICDLPDCKRDIVDCYVSRYEEIGDIRFIKIMLAVAQIQFFKTISTHAKNKNFDAALKNSQALIRLYNFFIKQGFLFNFEERTFNVVIDALHLAIISEIEVALDNLDLDRATRMIRGFKSAEGKRCYGELDRLHEIMADAAIYSGSGMAFETRRSSLDKSAKEKARLEADLTLAIEIV